MIVVCHRPLKPGQVEPEPLPEQIAAFGIKDKGGIMALFSSHPPIEDRIAVLEERAQSLSDRG